METNSINSNSSVPTSFIEYSRSVEQFQLNQGDFVEVIHSGGIQFFAKYSARIVYYNDAELKNEIRAINHYFIQIGDRIEKINRTKKSIIQLFRDKKSEIRKLARELEFRRNDVASMNRLVVQIDMRL